MINNEVKIWWLKIRAGKFNFEEYKKALEVSQGYPEGTMSQKMAVRCLSQQLDNVADHWEWFNDIKSDTI